MHPGRNPSKSSLQLARLTALALCVALAACSAPEQIVLEKQPEGEFRIMPPNPLVGNELNLAWGGDAASPRSSAQLASDESEGYSIIWSVNGNKIGRGKSLQAGLFRRGDRVSIRLEGDPVSQERAFTIIGNSPPEIRNVSVSRSPENPNVAVALFDARDPDSDRLLHHFEWTVDGVLIEGHDSPELALDAHSRGQAIAVRISTSDGELAATRESTGAQLENHPPAIEIGASPRIVERDGDPWAELDLAATDSDGDDVEIRVSGDVEWDANTGTLSWQLGEGDKPFDVTILATDVRGATAERRARLKR